MGSTKPFRKGAKPKEETSFLPGGKQSSVIYYLDQNSAVQKSSISEGINLVITQRRGRVSWLFSRLFNVKGGPKLLEICVITKVKPPRAAELDSK